MPKDDAPAAIMRDLIGMVNAPIEGGMVGRFSAEVVLWLLSFEFYHPLARTAARCATGI